MYDSFTLQTELRPVLPVIRGCKDYTQQQGLLQRVDRILRATGIEDLFVELHIQNFLQQLYQRTRAVGLKEHQRKAQESIQDSGAQCLKTFCTAVIAS
jgi:hypothetical protein